MRILAALAMFCVFATKSDAYTCADVRNYFAQHGWAGLKRFAREHNVSAWERVQALACLRSVRRK